MKSRPGVRRLEIFSVELAEHFWRSLAETAKFNLHIDCLRGRNTHHILEGTFKATARACVKLFERDRADYRCYEHERCSLKVMAQVGIIDYGVGNLRSVEKAFRRERCDAVVSADERVLRSAERFSAPRSRRLRCLYDGPRLTRGFDQLIRERVAQGTPLLGVCVGMQCFSRSRKNLARREAEAFCVGACVRFSDDLVVPQVGWNQISQRGCTSQFLKESQMKHSSISSTRSIVNHPMRASFWARLTMECRMRQS